MHNNIFYRASGTGTPIVRTTEALWRSGAELIAGRNNWVQTGLTVVPSQWTGTITGTDPQFGSPMNNDFRPAAGSPLANAGTSTPQSAPGYPFPSPLFPPSFHPPGRTLVAVGAAEVRPSDGFVDIGAYEYKPTVGVHENSAPPVNIRLEQNFPNPFNPTTVIRYHLAEASGVKLTVYDVLGRVVAVLTDDRMSRGTHEATFDATGYASGVYFYRLLAGEFVQTKCLALQK
jgi:hypothetical protein